MVGVRDVTDRIPLAEGWALWPWFRLKSAGFPAARIDALATPRVVDASQRLAHAEDEARQLRDDAIALVSQTTEITRERASALRDLRAGRAVKAPPLDLVGACVAIAKADAAREAAHVDLARAYAADVAHVGTALKEAIAAPALREALAWQNAEAQQRITASLARRPPEANDSKTREKKCFLGLVLQRYCLKNDSIGFFGPIGWGTLDAPGASSVEPGGDLLATRTTYFEHWAIDTLASRLAARHEIRRQLAPRRMPGVRVEGDRVYFPVEKSGMLPPPVARVLARIDGVTSATDIVSEVARAFELDADDEEALFDALEELCERRLVTWTLEIPSGTAYPERALRELLEKIPGASLTELDRLEAGRAAIARAAGDPDVLGAALTELGATFQAITGRSPTRRAGEIYAARTLVYEDCRRDVAIAFGPALRDRLAAPLSLILTSARWYTFTLATRYRSALEEHYRELVAETGDRVVDYLHFWSVVAPIFGSEQRKAPPIVAEVAAELAARWAEIFGTLPEGAIHRLRSADLVEQVGARFAAPHPGWPSARHHSPDILVAARDLAAGDLTLVLGEVHPSTNTLMPTLALEQHPNPELLIRAREEDIVQPCVSPVESKAFTTRADHTSRARHDFHLELDATRSPRPRDQILSTGELVVTEEEGRLVVRTRDRRASFDVVAFFEQYIMFACIAHFDITPKAAATPRVMIDDLVVSRKKWRFTPDALPFLHEPDLARALHLARSWVTTSGLPRRVFVKVPEEPKPVFVDFESLLFLEIFTKLARRASSISLSEMIPSPDDLWLVDAEGHRYTSELRLVAVDPIPWRP